MHDCLKPTHRRLQVFFWNGIKRPSWDIPKTPRKRMNQQPAFPRIVPKMVIGNRHAAMASLFPFHRN
ncbi:MAG: hypothetical protein CMM01_07720 [Rhodopirellula sp.]|nr:hypothetical protein [Rhodopirellula sp.]